MKLKTKKLTDKLTLGYLKYDNGLIEIFDVNNKCRLFYSIKEAEDWLLDIYGIKELW